MRCPSPPLPPVTTATAPCRSVRCSRIDVGGSLEPVRTGGNHYDRSTKPAGKPDGGNMGRKYDVIDADGHVLEPFSLWDDYMDPQYRERAPKLVKDENGKERLLLEDKILGSRAEIGRAHV